MRVLAYTGSRILFNIYNNTREQTWDMLDTTDNWVDFSADITGAGGSTGANSVESVHNNIHGFVGAGGHMQNPTVSGLAGDSLRLRTLH